MGEKTNEENWVEYTKFGNLICMIFYKQTYNVQLESKDFENFQKLKPIRFILKYLQYHLKGINNEEGKPNYNE
jgi:hypothetical protein